MYTDDVKIQYLYDVNERMFDEEFENRISNCLSRALERNVYTLYMYTSIFYTLYSMQKSKLLILIWVYIWGEIVCVCERNDNFYIFLVPQSCCLLSCFVYLLSECQELRVNSSLDIHISYIYKIRIYIWRILCKPTCWKAYQLAKSQRKCCLTISNI